MQIEGATVIRIISASRMAAAFRNASRIAPMGPRGTASARVRPNAT